MGTIYIGDTPWLPDATQLPEIKGSKSHWEASGRSSITQRCLHCFGFAYWCAITGLSWLHSYMVQYQECSYRSSI